MWKKIREIWQFKDLRNNILFVVAMLIIFRVAAHIPIPGINLAALNDLFARNQILGLVNVLSGGAMANFSVIAMGVGPYITASIIMQLLTMIIPKLEELSKEGSSGHQKINQYSRILTVPLAMIQSYSMIRLFNSSGQIFTNFTPMSIITTIIVMTGGTVFLMWLGELISEKKVGNGISLIIFAGIVERIPSSLQHFIVTFTTTQLTSLLVFVVLGVITIAGVVLLTEGQRNIPVSFARRIRGNKMYGGTDTYLPVRVNQAGMIPIIFAISIVLLPSLAGQFMQRSAIGWVASLGGHFITIFQNQIVYGIVYFVLVVAFTYFYTTIVFHPRQIAENLQKQGGFVPGIRPGESTVTFLGQVSNRIMLAGALSLGIIAVLPLITQGALKVSAFTVGGASLLIVVSVVLETMKQIESQLAMREYEA
ncbi:MAG: preprotein translocase subunit SecY [Patescibacteria group bacterium]|nr:preprotein translocase subunit SecY [Patescibacteria group bacterium]MDD5121035.1 preprotein translocase subunit SecY [Patescibacteria group bacterium]MDD5221604.1 preprotein translocase subunit SecY [Patescibacteria group bacterium]MDD5396046.1 preprotein translocase subunit SecY [Patescibacteria group bacterium]